MLKTIHVSRKPDKNAEFEALNDVKLLLVWGGLRRSHVENMENVGCCGGGHRAQEGRWMENMPPPCLLYISTSVQLICLSPAAVGPSRP